MQFCHFRAEKRFNSRSHNCIGGGQLKKTTMYMNGTPGPLLVFIPYIISISQMDVGGGPAAVVGGGAAPAAVPATGYFLLLRKNFEKKLFPL